jgi:hypothetical protein
MGFELILVPPFLKPIPLGLIVLLERKQGKPVVKPTRAPGPGSQILSLYERVIVFLII